MTAILRDVPKTFSFEEQRTEINEIAWDLYNLQLGQVVLSVSVQPEGNANLTYDSNTGVFEYTPPDLSAFLTGETDPIFSASPAAGITAQDISNWNTAYSWGDHSTEGYLKGIGAFSLNALLDVRYTGVPSQDDIIKWDDNGTSGPGWYLATDVSIDLLALSVSTIAPNGGGSLSYNNTSGVFTFAPAVAYNLPVASTIQLGGVKIDGTTITIDANGVISGSTQGTIVTTEDTAPANPNDGDLWWKSDEGQLKIYYNDGDSNQWVDTGGSGTPGSSGGTGPGGIQLGDLSVIKPNPAAAGNGDLTYNGSTGEFTFTPVVVPTKLSDLTNDAGFITGYTETDPIFSASAASGITSQKIADWNESHSWGNHANGGYITSETDPVFSASAASGVTSQKIINWDTAYGWGDHSQENYLNGLSSSSIGELGNVTLNNENAGDVLKFQGGVWVNLPDDTGTTINTLNDIGNVQVPAVPTDGHVLKWDLLANKWVAAPDQQGSGGGGGGIDLTDLSVTTLTPSSSGSLLYNDTTGVFTFTPPDIGDFVEFWQYANVNLFPNVSGANAGKLAYANDTGSLYYCNGSNWTSQRIVTTNSTTTNDFETLLDNFQEFRTYTLSTLDHTAGGSGQDAVRKTIKLTDNIGNYTQFVLAAGVGLSIARSSNPWGDDEITFNTTGGNYSISTETDTAPDVSKIRLTDSVSGNTDELTFVGADGLKVERTDEHTLTFRQGGTNLFQYTDDMAKDAAANSLVNGTHTDIDVTYDSANKVVHLEYTGSNSGNGGGATYDLQGRNTTSDNAFIDLVGSNSTTDSIEFVGSGGSSIAWDSVNTRITVSSPSISVTVATAGTTNLEYSNGVFTYTPPDLANYLTSIPQASASVLGGIKVGANLTMDAATGELSAVQGNYTLPTAGVGVGGTKGGVKVDGSTITIDGNGVISSSGGSTVPSIGDIPGTSASIVNGARGELEITGYKGYVLYKIVTDADAWVRIYCDDASRQADVNRSEGNDPAPGSGVIAEARIDGTQLVTPGVMGFNNDSPTRTETIYLSINNRSGSDQAITVTLTLLKIGE